MINRAKTFLNSMMNVELRKWVVVVLKDGSLPTNNSLKGKLFPCKLTQTLKELRQVFWFVKLQWQKILTSGA